MRKLSCLMAAITLIGAPLAAQEWVNVGIWGNGILGQQALRHAEEATRSGGARADREATATPDKRHAVVLPFTRSGDMTGQIEQAVAARLQQLVSLKFQMDDAPYFVRTAATRPIYRRELDERQLPEDSLAGATALFLAVGWELANGRELSIKENRAILRQTSEQLQATPHARASNAQRQQQAEMRLIIAGLWLEEARVRARSPRLRQDMAEAVWKDMKTITGNDLRIYNVTAGGFTRR